MQDAKSFGLKANVLQQILSVLTAHPEIEKVVLYGSRAKGNYKNGSDIDLCLFGQDLTISKGYSIENALDDLNLPYHFDITLYNNLDNKELIEHIHRIGVRLL